MLQICLFGTVIPLHMLSKDGAVNKAGIKFSKAYIMLPVSFLLAVFTFYSIAGDLSYIQSMFTPGLLGPALYVMTANIYEVIFFFVFLRYYMERAFGIIPGILLAAFFYSIHHAGFQPEFAKLFAVGLTYITIFRIADNWLVCFPIWWAGGLGDVLFQSEAVNAELIDGRRAILPFLVILLSLFIILRRKNNPGT